jgi:long-chain acyl-CoA synthetase
VTLDPEALVKWSAGQGVAETDPMRLAALPEVKALVEQEVEHANRGLASFESVKQIRIVPREFSIEEGELTPSLKIKRRVVVEKFQGLLDEMYEE